MKHYVHVCKASHCIIYKWSTCHVLTVIILWIESHSHVLIPRSWFQDVTLHLGSDWIGATLRTTSSGPSTRWRRRQRHWEGAEPWWKGNRTLTARAPCLSLQITRCELGIDWSGFVRISNPYLIIFIPLAIYHACSRKFLSRTKIMPSPAIVYPCITEFFAKLCHKGHHIFYVIINIG